MPTTIRRCSAQQPFRNSWSDMKCWAHPSVISPLKQQPNGCGDWARCIIGRER